MLDFSSWQQFSVFVFQISVKNLKCQNACHSLNKILHRRMREMLLLNHLISCLTGILMTWMSRLMKTEWESRNILLGMRFKICVWQCWISLTCFCTTCENITLCIRFPVCKFSSSWVRHLIVWEYGLVFYYLEALSFKLFEDGNFLFLKYSMTAKILGSELLLNT